MKYTTMSIRFTPEEKTAIDALVAIAQAKLDKSMFGVVRVSATSVVRDLIRQATEASQVVAESPKQQSIPTVVVEPTMCSKADWADAIRAEVMKHEAALRIRFGEDTGAAIELAVQNTRGWLKKRVVGDTREFQAIPIEHEPQMRELLPSIASAAVSYAISRAKIPSSYFAKAAQRSASKGAA